MNTPEAVKATNQSVELAAGQLIDVAAVDLVHAPVPAEQDGGNAPSTGFADLGTLEGTEFGVWEMSTGTMFDVESEEVFVVTAGRGSVYIEPRGDMPEQRVELFPGALMRLAEGMKTTWTVTETLRKVYFTTAAVTASERTNE